MSASRAYEMGMVNKVVSKEELESTVMDMATKISAMPRLGLTLTKQAINHVEDLQGKRNGMEAAFAWHHFSHAHNDLTTGNVLAGFDAKKMAKSQRTKKKKIVSRSNFEKNDILSIYVIARGEKMAFFGKIFVTLWLSEAI